jgi:hypothetical protein
VASDGHNRRFSADQVRLPGPEDDRLVLCLACNEGCVQRSRIVSQTVTNGAEVLNVHGRAVVNEVAHN